MFYVNDEPEGKFLFCIILYCIRSSRQRLAAVSLIVFVSLSTGVLTIVTSTVDCRFVVFVSLCTGVLTQSSRQRLAAVLFIVFVSLCLCAPVYLHLHVSQRLVAVSLIVFVSLCAGSVPAAENLYDRQAYGWLRFR